MIATMLRPGPAATHRTARPVRRPATTGPATRRDPRRPGPAIRPGSPPAFIAPRPAERRPHRWFAQRLLDVLSGRRPIGWMLGHVSGPAYDRLWELAGRTVLRPPAGRPTPVLRRCGYASPAPGVLEAYALIASGTALRALAFRLERGQDHRWRCAAVDFAGPSW
jgi:hypothetical protein